MESTRLQQVYVPLSGDHYETVACPSADKLTPLFEQELFQSRLLQLCPSDLWYNNSYSTFCPHPVLIAPTHQQRLKDLNNALALAITDIVSRWWTDSEAQFPQRMPLDPKEEALLQWVENQPADMLPAFCERRGSWRPDFLVEQDTAGQEIFRITEINARFAFNGSMHVAYGAEALQSAGITGERTRLAGATSFQQMVDGLLRIFDPRRPLHLIKGKEAGIDIHMLLDFLRRNLGLKPRLIGPADLRLVPDPGSKAGFKLCCTTEDTQQSSESIDWEGEVLEEIHQVGLELHQQEFMALSPEMLRQLSLRCFNDIRTILLVHDKRMLGILQQELKSLVARGVLSPAQADCLDSGVTETMIPGSPELMEFLARCRVSPNLKDSYILKPVRSGKGDGIVFGDALAPSEWISRLERLRCPDLEAGNSTCIVQRQVSHVLYDMMLQGPGKKERYPLVGTYHCIGGEYIGLGIWRSSLDRVCAISHGGAWICSVMDCERNSSTPY